MSSGRHTLAALGYIEEKKGRPDPCVSGAGRCLRARTFQGRDWDLTRAIRGSKVDVVYEWRPDAVSADHVDDWPFGTVDLERVRFGPSVCLGERIKWADNFGKHIPDRDVIRQDIRVVKQDDEQAWHVRSPKRSGLSYGEPARVNVSPSTSAP